MNIFRTSYRSLRRPIRHSLTPSLPHSSRYYSTHKPKSDQVSECVSKDCWSCGQFTTHSKIFCNHCGKLQPLTPSLPHSPTPTSPDQTPNNPTPSLCYFDLLAQPRQVQVCSLALEREFKALQKKLHPDKYASACVTERELSMANSSVVNQAYQTLKRPEERIAYLLSNTYGVNALAEDSLSYIDPQLMIDMFALREKIEELEESRNNNRSGNGSSSSSGVSECGSGSGSGSSGAVPSAAYSDGCNVPKVEQEDTEVVDSWEAQHAMIVAEVDQQVSELMPLLQEHFDKEHLDKATSLAVRLKYLFKAKEELENLL